MSSVCSGAFVLAAAGVLDGKRATTHWSAATGSRAASRASPSIANAIFVATATCGPPPASRPASTWRSRWSRRITGARSPTQVAGRLVLYVRRPGFQSQFSDALVAQTDGSDPLGPAIAWARRHLAEADVETLARRAGLSVRTLHRRCLETLETTPGTLLDKLRVEHARTLLSSTALPAKTLAAQCGFGNAVRMRRAFERELGMGPREYRALHAAR